MFKKFAIAGIIGLSFYSAIPQAEASVVTHINTSVTVSGLGGMCRDVAIIVEYEASSGVLRDTRRMLRRQMEKTVRDYRTTHRRTTMRFGPVRRARSSGRMRIKAIGRVCFRSL